METLNLEQAYYISEMVATVAVIMSLIYVALQLRQNTSIIKLTSAQNLSHELRESLALLAANAELSDIHLRAMQDIEKLNPGDKFRFYIFLNNVFRVYESAHYQYSRGTVDPAVWMGITGNMNATKLLSGYEAFWRERKNIFNKAFQDFYDTQMTGNSNTLDAFTGKRA